jgi:hypothetical protein
MVEKQQKWICPTRNFPLFSREMYKLLFTLLLFFTFVCCELCKQKDINLPTEFISNPLPRLNPLSLDHFFACRSPYIGRVSFVTCVLSFVFMYVFFTGFLFFLLFCAVSNPV